MSTKPTDSIELVKYEALICLLGKLGDQMLALAFRFPMTNTLEFAIVFDRLDDNAQELAQDFITDFEAYHPYHLNSLRYDIIESKHGSLNLGSGWEYVYLRRDS